MADDEGAASARAKAEARRQKILASSGERMGVVSGGTEGNAPASTGDTSAPREGNSSNGMSKYAAARRRRFGNKKAAAPASAEEKPAEDKPAAAEPPSASASETKAKAESEEAAPVTASETEPTKKDEKKYMGVAKMRRKMLAEKKKKKKDEEDGGAGSFTSADSSSGRKLGVPRSMSTVARETVKKHRAAVLMQLFTLALLFLAGLGVGMQNHALNEDQVVVSEQLSFKENGVGALRILGLGGGSGGGDDAAKEARERLLEEEEKAKVPAGEKDEATDEFGDSAASTSTKPKGVGGDDGEKVPNIDPLFRVDLDEVAAGPGLFNMVGRVAIKFHRFLMYLILVLPVSILNSILALPRALMSNPPILFLLTIVIRYLGRDILGATLPDLNAAAGGGLQENDKDLVSSAKNMVMNFLSSSFPNAAKCIEVMADAREDMFVILFGLFVGLVLPIHLRKEAGKDEL